MSAAAPHSVISPGGAPQTVRLHVDVYTKAGVRVGSGDSDPVTIYPHSVKTAVDHQRMFAGDTTNVTASVDGEAATPESSCRWIIKDIVQSEGPCIYSYRGEADPKEAEREVTIAVEVRRGGDLVGTSSATVVVVAPTHHVVYVVDASARTATGADQSRSLLDMVKDDLLSDLPGAVGRNVGIEAFGSLPSPAQPCPRNLQTVVPLGPLDLRRLIGALTSLAPGPGPEPQSPLFDALDRGIKDLAPYTKNSPPGAYYRLVVITTGWDNCRRPAADTLLTILRAKIREADSYRLWTEFRFLAVAFGLALNRDDSLNFADLDKGSSENPIIPIPVRDTATLIDLLRAVVDLGAGGQARDQGCQHLVQYLGTQKLSSSRERMLRACNVLRTP